MANEIRNIIPRINGEIPAWCNLMVSIDCIPTTGITAIDYKSEVEMEDVRGLGGQKQGRGYGHPEDTGSITLLREEIEAMRSGSPTGRLQDIPPFDIILQFIRVGQTRIIEHKLLDVQYKSDGMEIAAGDKTKNNSICKSAK